MKFGFGLFTMFLVASCLDAGPPGDEAQVSTIDQGIQSCFSTCDPPTYNGVAVGCTSATFCISAPEAAYCLQPDGTYFVAACATPPAVSCGDGICNGSETPSSCPADCPPPNQPFCGNGICETGERRATCPEDCGQPPNHCPTCPIP